MGASVAILGVVRRMVDKWAIRIQSVNLSKFDGLGNGEATSEQGKALTEMTGAEIVEK